MRARETAFARSLWPLAIPEPGIAPRCHDRAPDTLEGAGSGFNRGDRVRIIGKGRGPYAVRPGLGRITAVLVRVVWVLVDGKRSPQSVLTENVEPVADR